MKISSSLDLALPLMPDLYKIRYRFYDLDQSIAPKYINEIYLVQLFEINVKE